jgi:5-formyltetrahydrofolate cyclo-ligase
MSKALQDIKQRLRQEMVERRRSLTSAVVASRSELIAAYFCAWPQYRSAKTVMLYLAMPDEPQTDALIFDALSQGKTVCVPLLLGKKYGEMEAAEITGLDNLVTGRLGLKMPDPDKSRLILPDTIDMAVIPGVAFDATGNRLGMGAGYYDRFLTRTCGCIMLGLAWSEQLTSGLPHEEHDIRMQYLLTEGGFLPCSGDEQ